MSDTPWVIVQNPKIDRIICAIRDGSGRHVAYTAVVDAQRIVGAINGAPAKMYHPNKFRAK